VIISDTLAKQYMKYLHFTAAKDSNDIIANAASALAVKLEKFMPKGHVLSEVDQRLISYSMAKMPVVSVSDEKHRRKQYKRREVKVA
jgi:hypothetical protein